jgi:hypothetical protein
VVAVEEMEKDWGHDKSDDSLHHILFAAEVAAGVARCNNHQQLTHPSANY